MAHHIRIGWTEINPSMVGLYQNTISSFPRLASGATSPSTALSNYRLKGDVGTDPYGNPKVDFSLDMEILEDIDMEVVSDFDTAESDIPFAELLSSLGRINSLVSGVEPGILNLFKVPTWKSTQPLRIPLAPILYTKYNSLLDVYIPGMSLVSMSALKRIPNTNAYKVPGVYLGNLGGALKARDDAKPARNQVKTTAEEDVKIAAARSNSNFISIEIDGLIRLDTCFLAGCKPKWSKQKTESGVPLWCALDMQIQTFLPASDTDLFSIIEGQDPDFAADFASVSPVPPSSTLSNIFR